jgi:hypothetical protein
VVAHEAGQLGRVPGHHLLDAYLGERAQPVVNLGEDVARLPPGPSWRQELVGELRQIVFLETAAAMLVTAAVGVGLGLATSYALALFGDMVWIWPDGGVFAMVGIGVLAALILSAMALPLLDAATRYDAVRFE